MDAAFDFNLRLYVDDLNQRFGPDYISVAQEPIVETAIFDHHPTHRWTFLTSSGHYLELTLDAHHHSFMVWQHLPGEFSMIRDVNMKASVHENLARAFKDAQLEVANG